MVFSTDAMRVCSYQLYRPACLYLRGSMFMTNAVDNLTPQQRHHIYKMGKFEVLAYADGTIEITGPLVPNLIKLCKTEPSSTHGSRRMKRSSSIPATPTTVWISSIAPGTSRYW